MLTLLFIAALAVAPAPDPFTSLDVYNGTWSVHAQHPFSGGTGPDTLVNHCTHGQAFFSCEQVVNGKPAALVVFTISSEAGKFDVDNIFPNGHASSNTDLLIHGDHWTFLTHAAAPGDKRYRTENVFHGPDAIHFEQFESTDDGKTWTKTNEGDESRLRP
jgi:hypothetical protein